MRTPLLVVALLAADASASIPSPFTTPHLVLHSNLILVARCRQKAELRFEASLHAVDVREVIANWSGITDFRGLELDATIPCTILGMHEIVPQDRDVLLFVQGHPGTKRLMVPYACSNAVVALDGTAIACHADGGIEKVPGRRFLARVRALVRTFHDSAWLQRAIEGAVGSRHPFGRRHRGYLENRLRWLERAVARAHDGWDAGEGIARSVEGDRPVFLGTGTVARALDASAVDLALAWEGQLRVEVHAAGRAVLTKRFGKDGTWSHTLDVPAGATLRVHVRGRVRVDVTPGRS